MRSDYLQLPCVKTSNFLMVTMAIMVTMVIIIMVVVVNMVVIVVRTGRDGTKLVWFPNPLAAGRLFPSQIGTLSSRQN